jgi:hypothetical protein
VLPRKEQHVYLLHPDSTTSANFIIFLLFINALDVGLPLLASSTDFLADIVIAESRHVSDTDLHVLGFVSTHFWHGTEVAGNLKIITVLVAFVARGEVSTPRRYVSCGKDVTEFPSCENISRIIEGDDSLTSRT